jgi:hypothetical protein
LSRRRVLVGAGALGAAALVGAVVLPRVDDDSDAGPATTGPGAATPTAGAIATIGAAYLAVAPAEEADEAFLRGELPTITASTADGVVDQLGTLAEPVQEDFAAARTATVDGWILAVSEARAAALVHLLGA